MPIMTGVTATRILRQRGYTLPIVAVTGNALSEDVAIFREAGANDILVSGALLIALCTRLQFDSSLLCC
jgi:CheY-like chemotaxis protein